MLPVTLLPLTFICSSALDALGLQLCAPQLPTSEEEDSVRLTFKPRCGRQDSCCKTGALTQRPARAVGMGLGGCERGGDRVLTSARKGAGVGSVCEKHLPLLAQGKTQSCGLQSSARWLLTTCLPFPQLTFPHPLPPTLATGFLEHAPNTPTPGPLHCRFPPFTCNAPCQRSV